jgi:hypothetical protein
MRERYRMFTDTDDTREDHSRDRLIRHIVNFLDVEYPNETVSRADISANAELLCIIKGTAVYRTYQYFNGTRTTGLYISVVGMSETDMERICIIHNYNVKQK